jgi:hypothetical protein
MDYRWYVAAVIGILAGFASMRQAWKNARTSQDSETGIWFVIGLCMALAGALVFVVGIYGS